MNDWLCGMTANQITNCPEFDTRILRFSVVYAEPICCEQVGDFVCDANSCPVVLLDRHSERQPQKHPIPFEKTYDLQCDHLSLSSHVNPPAFFLSSVREHPIISPHLLLIELRSVCCVLSKSISPDVGRRDERPQITV
jgi:hypothetical protein